MAEGQDSMAGTPELDFPTPLTTVDVVIFAIRSDALQVLLVQRPKAETEPFPGSWPLPGGFVDIAGDRDLEACAARKLKDKTGVVSPYLEPESAPPTPAPEADLARAADGGGALSDSDVDRIARRVVELIGDKAVRDVAWDVVPDLAELLLKARIRELEASVE